MELQDFLLKFPWPEEVLRLGTPLDFLWKFDLPASRAEIWPYVADTSRFNRELGLGKRQHEENNGIVYVKESLAGMPQEWIEEPWDWVAGNYFYIKRRYIKGCAKFFRTIDQLIERPDGTGVRLYIYVGWIPRNPFWGFALRAGMSQYERKFARVVNKINQSLEETKKGTDAVVPLARLRPQGLGRSVEERLDEIKKRLLRNSLSSLCIEQLLEHIRRGDELDLHRIRVVPLAKSWHVAAEDLLRVCLHAVRTGLLNLSWDLLCPHCRGVRREFKSLGELTPHGYCDICKISFDTAAPDAFEVTFRIHPSIREVPEILYCSAEPTKKPHILLQSRLPANARKTFRTRMASGRHRLRIIGQETVLSLEVRPGAGKDKISWDGANPGPVDVSEDLEVELENPEGDERCFVLEQLWWHAEAVKPVEILSLPEFRDLFSEEYLAADVKLELGEQTVLFTDIVGSTQFYENSGDAKAFLAVREHFKKVYEEVRRARGVVVKTIGDAVMAAFNTPRGALDAAVGIQNRFPAESDSMIRVRISIHTGPVIAVNLNTGIDYFGATVNLAAKLQASSGAGQIVVSAKFYDAVAGYCEAARMFSIRKHSFFLSGNSEVQTIYVIEVDRGPSESASAQPLQVKGFC